MDGGKPEKNPSVSVWLKHFDKDLYEAIDDQGILGILKPRFGSTLTFLYPAEKSYRDDIIAKLNGVDATIGVNMIQALVIKDMLADPAEWLEKKDNIPNALGQKVELSPESSNKGVVLANGALLSLNKDFKARDDNIAVWDYKGKAQMPLDGKPAEFVKRPPRAPGAGKKRKTAMGGSGIPVFPRKCILAKRLQDQSVCLLHESWQTFQESNPFTSAIMSLVKYVDLKHNSKLDELKLLVEPNSVAAFYAIVQPYSKTSYFDSGIIESWLQETRGVCMVPNPNKAWASFVQAAGPVGARIHSRVMEKKDQEIKPRALGNFGMSIYQNEFSSNPKARLNGDEMRFVINVVMSKKDNLSSKDLSDLFLDLEIIYGKDSDRSFFLVNDSNSDPVFLDTVVVFMSSRCFASVPQPSGGTKVSFQEVMNGTMSVDPYDHLISDDEIYLNAPDTNKDSEFIEGFRKVLQGMPDELRREFISSLGSA